MDKQKVGVMVFWIGVAWSFIWGIIGSMHYSSYLHTLTLEQIEQTVWTLQGPLMFIWGVLGVPLGAIIAGIGAALYSSAKISTAWKFGLGIFIGMFVGFVSIFIGHFPPWFWLGGTLLLIFFFGTLLLWAKERRDLKDSAKIGADLKLAGYVFMLIAAWFTCGITSRLFLNIFGEQLPSSPMHIMLYFVLGWLFLFLGHYKITRSSQNKRNSKKI
jgi:hypothetical protein